MLMVSLLLFLFCFSCFSRFQKYPYSEIFVDVEKDHFDFSSTDTYKHRVLVNNQFYDRQNPRVFVYMGNEGDILSFYNNTGAVFELGYNFSALIVFIEHRYFGKSIPELNSFKYFSIEQALEDYISVLNYLRDEFYLWNKTTTPIITFGGSYGGMLSSWAKLKYPNFYTGTLAASAPNLHFQGFVEPSLFASIVSKSFSRYGCNIQNILPSLISLNKLIAKESEYQYLEQVFRTCQIIKTFEDASKIYELVFLALQNLAVVNYPSKAEFFQPLPAYPAKVACESFLKEYEQQRDIEGLYEILDVYFNSSGNTECMDLSWGDNDIFMSYNWHFGRCSQVVMPMEFNGISDFFYPQRIWNLEEFRKSCEDLYNGIRVSPDWLISHYHGKIVRGCENIIFSNGGMDPWSSGGIYEENIPKGSSCVSIIIKGAAHHADLRFSDPNDPKELKDARELEKQIIRDWISKVESKK